MIYAQAVKSLLEHTKNEAINISVLSYAPKTKHYLGIDYLLTRVGIAGACQAVRYATYWSKVCPKYGFDIDPNLLSILSKRDEKKASKRVTEGTLNEKRKRGKTKHGKINKEHKDYMDSRQNGLL